MKKKRSFEARLTRLSIIASITPLIMLLWIMVYAQISIWLILLTTLFGIVLLVYSNLQIHQKLVHQFRSLNNLLESLTQGDYTLRARSDHSDGAMDELVTSINALASHLSQQRSVSVESQLLLGTVIDHIDVAIVAIRETNSISFFNPAAKKLLLLDQPESREKLLCQLASVDSLPSGYHQVVELSLGHQHGRFNVHVEEFRESGIQHKLLFITDLRTLLRSEERKAWQSLVRVISHEINNSLSPIASISQTLNRLVARQAIAGEYRQDLVEGLTIITERANGLGQFVDSYKQLAQIPEPKKEFVSLLMLLSKIKALFKHQSISITSTTDVQLFIDPIQFEQVLINLFKNAAESMVHTNPNGAIRVEWDIATPLFKLMICDQGGGINNPNNLFIPFYSTKKHGSGIGLVLCRQIIEAHNGRIFISNQEGGIGCVVTIKIPYEPVNR